MRFLGLDISTKTGWASFDDARLVAFGTIRLEKTLHEYGPYPQCYDAATEDMANRLMQKIWEVQPHIIVIEETNLGRNRYSQKALEFLHKSLLRKLDQACYCGRIVYISSSTWRKTLAIGMTAEDKRLNNKLSRAKTEAKHTGQKLDKQALGIRGKITKKHLALRWVNEEYKLNLIVKDNDTADAICLVASYLKGAPVCDGII